MPAILRCAQGIIIMPLKDANEGNTTALQGVVSEALMQQPDEKKGKKVGSPEKLPA